MARLSLFLLALFACFSSFARAATVEHSFYVKNVTVNRLCKSSVITAVNGSLPGPTVEVEEGDTLLVHVFNQSPYNITIHWHGILQLFSAWADGPAYVTQCPIQPGRCYTYRFTITGQEGTLWWHSHMNWLRVTVYGSLIIRPRCGFTYPFPVPYKEFVILLGDWWNANINDIENEALATGGTPTSPDAYTINGQPGDLYPCSSHDTYRLEVVFGKTYLLRVINAALNTPFFFKIANHTLTVVEADASYTNPYDTDLIVLSPGQTTNVLLKASQKHGGSYYLAAHPYESTSNVTFSNTTTTAILTYTGSSDNVNKPIMPTLPASNDTPTASKFFTSLTGLVSSRFWTEVPCDVDIDMFVTMGLSLIPCDRTNCQGPLGFRFAANMNNESFRLPTRVSMLESFHGKIRGDYSTDFPNTPPVKFDYTNSNNSLNPALFVSLKSTKVKRVKFDSVVQVVIQSTSLVGAESHPMHLHGYNFIVMAQGLGNYNRAVDSLKYNYVNPQIRNTIAVPEGGWAVIRFRANNPGVWLLHCHIDLHFSWGLSMGFLVENGPTSSATLPPPPPDLPKC